MQRNQAAPIASPTIDPALAEQRRRAFPLGAALTLAALEGYESGVDLQAQLLEHEPVTWFEEIQSWLVTGRLLLEEVLTSPDRFTVYAEDSFVRSVLGDHMLSRDDDDHRYMRAPYDPPLRLRAARSNYSTLINDLAADFLAAFRDQGRAELRESYANPLAITVAGRALGLAFDDIDKVSRAYDIFAAAMVDYSGARDATASTRAELDAIIMRNIERIRMSPDNSIISSVVESADVELRQADYEITANVRILLFGAIETVTSIILSTIWALLTHPDQLVEVRTDPTLVMSAVHESLRWISPVGHTERWATTDTALGSANILRGEMVLPSLAAANRDQSYFAEPDKFDVSRKNARHHSAFGKGEHHCIGLNLGNLEAEIAVRLALEGLPNLRLDPEHPSVPTGFGFRSPRPLWVLWDV
jgi:cytochrome P450